MPAWTDFRASEASGGHIGVKIVTVSPDNNALGKPAVMGLYLLLDGLTGEPQALIDRLGANLGCVSRKVLWANALYLASLKPWTGWGPGEMDYAHHVTLYPGERFCLIVDNAHNLFLHVAVEGGFVLAALLLLGLAVWVLRARPWREREPDRLLAWAALGVLMLHSQVEYPLWYGPFQLAALLAISLLWRPAAISQVGSGLRLGLSALATVAVASGVEPGVRPPPSSHSRAAMATTR